MVRQWKNYMLLNSGLDNKLRIIYTIFKHEFKIEIILYFVNHHFVRENIARFRISADNLKIGRHRRPYKVPLSEISCVTCNEIEEEIHLLINC